jgi:TPR repeat protein
LALIQQATTLMLTAVLAAQAATPADGRRAYDAGRFTDAMGIWAELSHEGNAEAAYGIGMLYDLGNGTKEDPLAAFAWYKIAAEAGVPAAEFNVGAMYGAGRGVGQDRASAALWYARAAARGHGRAEFDLGLLYEQGDGVPRNPDAAAAWFRDAEKAGIPAAGRRLKPLHGSHAEKPEPVSLTAPDRDAKLGLSANNPHVELVWTAPPEPWPARYEVEVRDLDGPDMPIVFDGVVTETADLVRLPLKAAFYVWNVITIGPDGSRTPSDWDWFSVNPPTRALASAPH